MSNVQGTNVGKVTDHTYADNLAYLNQIWSGGGGTGSPSAAARLQMALVMAGIPITNTQALKDIIAQSNFEYPSGPVGNNLLGTSLVVNGSHSTNQDGVQSYNSWQDGVMATAMMLQQGNMSSIYQALQANASPADYQKALAAGSWEGSDPGANATYAADVIARYNQLDANGTLKAMLAQVGKSDPALTTASAEGGVTPGLGIPDPLAGLGTIAGDLISGFGIGWKAVLTIIGGILLIGVGVMVVFRKQEGKVIEAAPMAAAAA